MAIPIRPDISAPPKEVDQALVAHLRELLALAEAGEVDAYLGAYIAHEAAEYWYTITPGWEGDITLAARRAIYEAETEPAE